MAALVVLPDHLGQPRDRRISVLVGERQGVGIQLPEVETPRALSFRPFEDGEKHAGVNGIGNAGNHQTEELCVSGAKARRQGMRHVAHVLGDLAHARLRGGGNVLRVSETLRNGHDRNPGTCGNIFQANHGLNR